MWTITPLTSFGVCQCSGISESELPCSNRLVAGRDCEITTYRNFIYRIIPGIPDGRFKPRAQLFVYTHLPTSSNIAFASNIFLADYVRSST